MRYLTILTLAVCMGCTTLESAAKMGARFALDAAQVALEEKIGEEGAKILEGVKSYTDRGIEAMAEKFSKETQHAAQMGLRSLIAKAGGEPGAFDHDDSGVYEDGELKEIEAFLASQGGVSGSLYLMIFYLLVQAFKWSGRSGRPGKLVNAVKVLFATK